MIIIWYLRNGHVLLSEEDGEITEEDILNQMVGTKMEKGNLGFMSWKARKVKCPQRILIDEIVAFEIVEEGAMQQPQFLVPQKGSFKIQ